MGEYHQFKGREYLEKINSLDIRTENICPFCFGKGVIFRTGWTGASPSKFCKDCEGTGKRMSLKDCVICDKQYFTRKEDQNMCDTCQAKSDEKKYYVSIYRQHWLVSKENIQTQINLIESLNIPKDCKIGVFELVERK